MHDIRSSARLRLRHWRSRKREEVRLARRAEKDAKRVAKGLLPLAEANRAKAAKFRAKQIKLAEMIKQCWFAPEMPYGDALKQIAAENPQWDAALVRTIVDGYVRACRGVGVNLNDFAIRQGAHKANHQRTVLHELLEQGVSLNEAVQQCQVEPFKLNTSLNEIEQRLDVMKRFSDAQERWHEGGEIIETLTGKKEKSDENGNV